MVITSWNGMDNQVKSYAKQRTARYILYYGGGIYPERDYQKLADILYQSGVSSFDWHFTPGAVEISNIRYVENF